MKKEQPKQAENLLIFKPRRIVQWEEQEDGRIVLLIPKFKNRLLVKYLLPRMKSKNFKIRLDEFGSLVWRYLDGSHTVMQIGELLHNEFGEKVEPVYDRLGLFVNMLSHRKFITLRDENA